ncbi:phosphatidylserine/phosphatidylglycerophosphate/cardiolipin synthase family protein [Ketobacter sp. MCCC 1A13808]|uniref:phospholipase D-like domain-containing protein n=1 Tax=Ketobacter sp. MCCC 1A13808 TaxID=2602738 RepID=UPI0012EC2E1A|nr:phospholipase D-like domain-containing protein [Ketobacter sp. MCCC 1A13808]MVF12677.1 phosphatidylserine/phosphatidylglycerophosphate/cardiolipin synthase family protein [Ketobacter sp. MCCC 1A13808]
MNLPHFDSFSCTLPWQTDCHFSLLIDGDEFYPRMLDALNQAHQSIELEMYLFESGIIATRYISALVDATKRGVQVRVLVDHVGSFKLQPSDQSRLRQAGVELRIFNRLQHRHWLRNLFRDHRKIIVIDRQLAFVGGAGISDSFSAEVRPDSAWRETMISIEGPAVQDWLTLFERSWYFYNLRQDEAQRKILLGALSDAPDKPLQNGTISQARVVASRGPGNKPIIATLLNKLTKSKQRAWLVTAYFYPSRKLVKALCKAARHGVDVRILLPGPNTDHPSIRYAGRSWYRKLLDSGVKIYEYQPRFLHMKVALVDNWVSIGSCNFDRWNLRWNLEANQEIIDDSFSLSTVAMLENDIEQALQIRLDSWKKRGWYQKVMERFWKWMGRFLARIPND